LCYLEDRFGIAQTAFDHYLFFTRRKGWWILKKNSSLAKISRLKVSQVGMRAFQQVGRYIKPTTRFVQIFGKLATKAVVRLDAYRLQSIVKGEPMSMDLRLENGYIILFYEDHPLGVGLYIDGGILAQLPKKETVFFRRWTTMEFSSRSPASGALES
jgi:NOL1/NOP2/fmu family ribosome biogenesis protein